MRLRSMCLAGSLQLYADFEHSLVSSSSDSFDSGSPGSAIQPAKPSVAKHRIETWRTTSFMEGIMATLTATLAPGVYARIGERSLSPAPNPDTAHEIGRAHV